MIVTCIGVQKIFNRVSLKWGCLFYFLGFEALWWKYAMFLVGAAAYQG